MSLDLEFRLLKISDYTVLCMHKEIFKLRMHIKPSYFIVLCVDNYIHTCCCVFVTEQSSSGDAGAIKATAPMWRCSRIMHLLRDLHPTLLSALEGIVDQVYTFNACAVCFQ